jgi:hypothetical protein
MRARLFARRGRERRAVRPASLTQRRAVGARGKGDSGPVARPSFAGVSERASCRPRPKQGSSCQLPL